MPVQGTVVRRPWVAPAASALLVVLGAYLLKASVFDVLAAAQRNEPSVRFSVKAVLCAPTFILLGLLGLVASFSKGDGNSWAYRHLSDPVTRKLKPLGWALVALIFATGGALYLWLRGELTGYGYDV